MELNLGLDRMRARDINPQAIHRYNCGAAFARACSTPDYSPCSLSGVAMTMLTGKAAIITGSTSGIGLGIARALGGAGCNVMLNGFGDASAIERERSGIEKAFGVRAAFPPADLSKSSEIGRMIGLAIKEFGQLDIVVNNAGIQHTAPVEQFPPDRWDAVIAINLSAH